MKRFRSFIKQKSLPPHQQQQRHSSCSELCLCNTLPSIVRDKNTLLMYSTDQQCNFQKQSYLWLVGREYSNPLTYMRVMISIFSNPVDALDGAKQFVEKLTHSVGNAVVSVFNEKNIPSRTCCLHNMAFAIQCATVTFENNCDLPYNVVVYREPIVA